MSIYDKFSKIGEDLGRDKLTPKERAIREAREARLKEQRGSLDTKITDSTWRIIVQGSLGGEKPGGPGPANPKKTPDEDPMELLKKGTSHETALPPGAGIINQIINEELPKKLAEDPMELLKKGTSHETALPLGADLIYQIIIEELPKKTK